MSDSTPDITYSYDRLGRQSGIVQGSVTTTRNYNDAGQLVTESYSGGYLDGISVTNTYDAYLRRSRLEAQASGSLTAIDYGYDAASRLSSVGVGNESAVYSYLANSPLVEQLAFKQSGTTRMTTTKAYDYLNRLTSIGHADASPTTLSSYSYGYNAANQRTNVVHADGSYWNYGYDVLGQVITAKKRTLNDLLFPGLQYEFDYDDIGNRKQTRTGGDGSGLNLRTNSYAANALNQYSSRDIGPYVEVHGQAATNATVTVNNQSTDRAGTFFRKELNPDNSAAIVNQGITNVAVLKNAGPDSKDIVSAETGSKLLQQNPENFTYDDDGNTLSDGLWSYEWNGENRLIGMTSSTNVPASDRRKLEFSYDHQGRRVSKIVSAWNLSSSAYVAGSTNLFVYDGWNLIATLNSAPSQSPTLHQSYAWGLDLSGSEQGAGGVGGLLFVADSSNRHFVGHDGNGNVMLLASADTATITAQYEYSPFGKVIRASGTMADANPIRFSGKYEDSETGYNYYGYRFYNPDSGRWLNRDPIEENGRMDVYAFNFNAAGSWIDPDGRAPHWNWNSGGGGSSNGGGVSAGVVLLLTLVCPTGACRVAGSSTTTVTVGTGTGVAGGLIAVGVGTAAGMAGLLIWYDSASGQATVIYPNPQIHGQNSVPCTVSALGSHGHTGVHNTPRCRQVRNDCQNECDETLPTYDDGFTYDRCVNQCVYDNNCGGINYRW